MNLHLTQVLLDYDTAFKAGLRDSYDWHQKVWQAFPNRDGARRDFLTRLDPLDEQLRLFVLSETPPMRPDWCPEPAWETKEVPPEFLEHSAYHFSLVANPTRKDTPRGPDGKRHGQGKRVPITHREDRELPAGGKRSGLLSWLARKAEAHGFAVDLAQVRTVPRPRQYFIKGGCLGLHSGVEFRGVLRVTDREKFRNALLHGIGSAKAFGFGLLVIAPISGS